MKQAIWTERRIAGGLLAGSLPIIVLALIILFSSEAGRSASPYMRGDLAQAAPSASTFRLLFLLSAVGWILQALGLVLLARLLSRAGYGQLAVLAFTLVLIAAVLAVLWATFRMSVELWAAEETAFTGSIPVLFAPLRAWSNSFFRLAYVMNLVAGASMGWGSARACILKPGLGWFAVAWSAVWLVAFAFGLRIPAVPVILPAVIGVALFFRKPGDHSVQ
jgi:hypothetical protein